MNRYRSGFFFIYYNQSTFMRRLLTSLLLFCMLMQKTAAQSISITTDGSQPVPGAMLDIKSINKGLLIPRIALTGNNDVATLPDRPVSLLIYNIATVAGTNAVDPGYYFWDGAMWARMISASTLSPNENTAIGFNTLSNSTG